MCMTDRDCAMGTCTAGACSAPIVAMPADGSVPDSATLDAGAPPCTDGACPPPNDECSGATPIVLVDGATALNGDLSGATPSPFSCLGNPDIYFRFDLAARSVLFVNASTNSVTLFSACGGAPIAGCSGIGMCLGGDIASFLTVLDPGTYYLLVDKDPGSLGYAAEVYSIPIAGAPRAVLGPGPQTLTGTTMPGTDTTTTCGHGDDDVYIIAACTNFMGGPVDADTCAATTFDTQLELDSGSGAATQCGMGDACSAQSRLSAWLPAGPGLWALRVGGATATDSGDYSLNVTLPLR
jgi:hypothetical protein